MIQNMIELKTAVLVVRDEARIFRETRNVQIGIIKRCSREFSIKTKALMHQERRQAVPLYEGQST